MVFLLQAQLTRSTVAEEANLAEIQRLASSAAEMQAELAFRPTRGDIDDLSAVVGKLRAELLAKDQQIDRHLAALGREKSTVDKAVETDEEAHDQSIDAKKISAEIDEMFRLDYEDEDEETDSAVTEINKDEDTAEVETGAGEAGDVSSVSASSFVRLDDSARLQVTLANGSLHALEEELVRAKERWAEVAEERARLAEALAQLQGKATVRLSLSHAVALLVPLVAAALYYVLLPYIS